ncbi:hypothetical protein CALCODRAFT_503770 [Calocera cornea HHB12733]|uniref:GYF domain-containing protein n=1 Tax=Calocera cornea HHB12733 TaxID=1353952 RepID=A0A165CRB7_9BASI|nr:hypothetical protein CALCODRAFT_503770 [Calocera cornea HHB12733]
MPPRSSRKRERSSPSPPPKRARFDDAALAAAEDRVFEDSVDANLEISARDAKRSVNVDGYESDSTDDGEGVVLSRRSGANEMADEEEDMFAPSGAAGKDGVKDDEGDDDDDDDELRGGRRKEKVLALGDIEGQEFGEVGGDDDDEEDEDEIIDEDEAERRAKKGMGFELTGFNMKEEMEEGKFVDDGTFVRTRDPHEMHDRWLEGTSEREMKRARRAHERREREEREREEKEQGEQRSKPKEEYELELVQLMKKGESVMETLQRLGAEAKRSGAQKHKAKRKPAGPAAAAMDVDAPPPANGNGHTNGHAEPTAIEQVTALASALMGLGDMDIYEETYEQLLRSVRRSGIVSPEWVPPSQTPPRAPSPPPDTVQYEYRWAPEYVASAGGTADAGARFGPFGKRELDAWRAAGYFGGFDLCERVQLRRVGDLDWGRWNTVFS